MPFTFTKIGADDIDPDSKTHGGADLANDLRDNPFGMWTVTSKPGPQSHLGADVLIEVDNDLVFAVGQNEIWKYRLSMEMTACPGGDWPIIEIALPAIPEYTLDTSCLMYPLLAGSIMVYVNDTASNPLFYANNMTTPAGCITASGIFQTKTGAGNAQVQWRKSAGAAGNLTFGTGSYFWGCLIDYVE